MAKTIFITGASKGFGKIWTEAFLKRGDNVIAAARDIASLDTLKQQFKNSFLALPLDVASKAACEEVIQKAHEHFGRLDVIINNAGHSLMGAIEETTEAQARNIMETNFFGTLWITQAALPILRAQQSGHIIQISSLLGQIAMPTIGLYAASKFAVEGFSEALAAEVKDMGIKVTIIEPNGYATDINNSSVQATGIKEYEPVKNALYSSFPSDAQGKPEATIEALLLLTSQEHPPLRLFLGKYAFPSARASYEQRLNEWEKWSEISTKAHG